MSETQAQGGKAEETLAAYREAVRQEADAIDDVASLRRLLAHAEERLVQARERTEAARLAAEWARATDRLD